MSQPSRAPHIHFIAQGSGPAIILVHGLAASSEGWIAMLPALIDAGYRVYAVDLLGHGDSDKPSQPEYYQVKEIYAALESWIKAQAFSQPIALIGHSLGGHLSLEYSLRHPAAVRAMALIDPFYSPTQLLPGLNWLIRFPRLGVKALRDYYPRMVPALSLANDSINGSLSAETRRQMFVDLHRAAPEILHLLPGIPDLTPRLSQVQTKTLVIFGSRDHTLRPASFPKMAKLIPDAVLIKIRGVGHQPHLAQPEIVNRYILDFLGMGGS
jgi:esterase